MSEVILEVTRGQSIGGMGTVTSICGFTPDGQRILWWSHAHHIDGPLSIDELSGAIDKVLRDHYDKKQAQRNEE
jgi:hypothetical protein